MLKTIKRVLKMLITDPNSPEGLRMRADRLIEQGYSPQNPAVASLVKTADLKEIEEKEQREITMKRKIDPLAFGITCLLSFFMAYGFTALFLLLAFVGWHLLSIDLSNVSFINLWVMTGMCLFFYTLYSNRRSWYWHRKKPCGT